MSDIKTQAQEWLDSGSDNAYEAEDIIKDLLAELIHSRDALEQLAKLGNGDNYGNSTGNTIAQEALGVKEDVARTLHILAENILNDEEI